MEEQGRRSLRGDEQFGRAGPAHLRGGRGAQQVVAAAFVHIGLFGHGDDRVEEYGEVGTRFGPFFGQGYVDVVVVECRRYECSQVSAGREADDSHVIGVGLYRVVVLLEVADALLSVAKRNLGMPRGEGIVEYGGYESLLFEPLCHQAAFVVGGHRLVAASGADEYGRGGCCLDVGAVDNNLGILDIAQVVAVPVGFAREPLGKGGTVGPQEYLFGFVALLTVDEGACEGDVAFEPALVEEQGGPTVLIGRGACRPAGPFALAGRAVVRHGDVSGDEV